ncbi:DUF4358 domain-containing protein [Paenibacillus sp. MER TA 81-3]|uniref:DUF4358 domain-containing protein n=1 Tax=Paenibacillus sp. MER TA 81-3 TaxID=2939573 RepID=UPI00203DEE5E|nr:DUF4358 domain-containing protein [Paenibacillus sp. MER TA 81-3]MCM3340674.1 DUF4358 domain-containing protein [Paenibacillus sp. MER TA 81-3]
MKQSVILDKLKKGDANKLKKLYVLGTEQVEDFILYTANSNVKANIAKRIDAQTVKFKDYRPDEYALLEKRVLKVQFSYILFAVSTDAAQIERAFDEAFK